MKPATKGTGGSYKEHEASENHAQPGDFTSCKRFLLDIFDVKKYWGPSNWTNLVQQNLNFGKSLGLVEKTWKFK